jgi:hypothetical protein
MQVGDECARDVGGRRLGAVGECLVLLWMDVDEGANTRGI